MRAEPRSTVLLVVLYILIDVLHERNPVVICCVIYNTIQLVQKVLTCQKRESNCTKLPLLIHLHANNAGCNVVIIY